MSPVIDQAVTWRKVEERLETETDPILRRNLETAARPHEVGVGRRHRRPARHARRRRALPRVRCTRPAQQPVRARTACARFYERFVASGAGRLQLDIDRLVVDRDCILTEGVMRMAYPGRTLQAMGIEVDDPDAHYLYEARMATLWPFDADGKVLGEDTYTGSDGFAGIAERKLDEADIVEHAP